MCPFSGFLGDDLTVFPDVYRRTVHAGSLPRRDASSAQRSTHGRRERLRARFLPSLHGSFSNNVGRIPELSYTAPASASATSAGRNGDSPASIPTAVLGLATNVWIFRRIGLLALVAIVCANGAVQNCPLTAASCYAPLALTTLLLVVSLYVILPSRPGTASRSAAEPLV